MVGNALEWYDFILYAQFAYILKEKFFPDSYINEILTFAIFAAGFIVRPIGGIIFGNIGDRFGRRMYFFSYRHTNNGKTVNAFCF